MKNRWIYIVIIFLLSANLALLITLLVRGPGKIDRNFIHFKNHGNAPMHRQFEDNLSRDLNWSKEQLDKVHDFGKVFREKKIFYNLQIDSIQAIYYKQLGQESPDTILLHQLADKLGFIKSKMILLDYQHYRNIRSVCNPEQADKMDSLGNVFIIQRHKKNCNGNFKGQHNR